MTLSVFHCLPLICIVIATAKIEELKETEQILELNNLAKVDMSSASKELFQEFMSTLCWNNLTPKNFLENYIRWEKVEFLESAKKFLVPSQSDHHLYNKYFFHLGHNFLSNCTVKNDKKWRESHFEKHENDLFDTYMYDGMAHREWATLEL
ncbi:TryThrA_C domain-containing protein [Caenorhabditis elegans]|uniref:TryThrA_C domain-containing protein n=1 Tax=Caenorhabditis elegans TaxID=6239 RepID=Q22762_CAEEL|nr:TryThrA_C domain-containing protein [Caenorhabditis elegans]CCD65389.1 TryThrA_C domain-containing protein [Caenorhabditis elegans]|eukprot:NP_509526.1 Uncharacterized protein CELE_T25B6.3 [Caenorhabditis elegans]